MVKMSAIYQGEKHCELTHTPSGSKIETDAPVDNNGRGERFSPTDLTAHACPVHKSLHPEINAPIEFIYQD